MDLGIVVALLMLVGWAISTFFFNGPGWVHLFLTLGVTMLVWRMVARKTPPKPDATKPG